jgi:outer membrane protein OmpA-like peptidoglycan-associated protein
MTRGFLFSTATAAALALSGCTYPDGEPNKPATGALIGGLTGAVVGNAIGGHSNKGTIIGGVVGAAIGGAIGTQLAEQERELRGSLSGTGADIRNDGSRLYVVLPESVTFATDSATVNSGFLPALRDVADSLRRHPASSVRVVGHTDNVGTEAYNADLSTRRALAVARVLISGGTASDRITYAGRGFADPVASNSTSAGRAANRRVEIIITPRS